MSSPQRTFGNWNPEHDRTGEAVLLRSEMLVAFIAAVVTLVTGDNHSLFNARLIITSSNQGNQGSCTANGCTSALEYLIWCATGRVVALSRQWLYIKAQNRSGIRSDSGASISQAIWIMIHEGVPLEKYQPYPSRYTRKLSAEATHQAQHCKLQEAVKITSYEEAVAFLRPGGTAIVAGMAWGGTMSSAGKRIETFKPGGGGHCICWPQLTPGTEHLDEPDIDLDNSHGKRWGDGGVAAMSPRCVREIFAHRDTAEFGGVIGLHGVTLTGPDFTDLLDDGKEGMIA